ncbi:Nonspecific acid phosphatase [Neorhizobium galegae bv. orientalis]|nr:Nonspecific acid phosphatase [Neorhizobium galegae bv. orientalis]
MTCLGSWNDGPAKTAILDFVAAVTDESGDHYVRPTERIAVFDNDGTLWCEHPMQAQIFFLIDRVKQLADKDPEIRDREPFKALLEHNHATLHRLGKQALMELAFATHAGMTEEEFDVVADAWLSSARHPSHGRLFTQCTYQPQIELMELLRGKLFRVFIVSGGGIDLIRSFAEEIYGIPHEQVIGSSARLRYELRGDRAVLMKAAELNSFDDREVKPTNIGLHIGRRPILAFGNSDGDLAMLRYTKSGSGLRLALLIHHDDEEREAAYDRDFRLSPLAEALDRSAEYGITVVSMKRDWKTVFDDL